MNAPSPWGIWGHQHAVAQLQNSILVDRAPHAILLSGMARVGKTTLALALAKSLLCVASETGSFCGGCATCRRIDKGVHPDVEIFSRQTQQLTGKKDKTQNLVLTIETVRQISVTSAMRPLEGIWRVILVDDVEAMQGVAQEALLKTLEEPPSFLVLILMADDASQVLPTIESRCRCIALQPVATAEIAGMLRQEGLPSGESAEVARLAAGSPGWAKEAVADAALKEARVANIDAAMAWLEGTDYQRLVTAFQMGEQFPKRREATFEQIAALSGILRDVMLSKADANLPPALAPEQGTLEHLAAGWSLAATSRALRATGRCIDDLLANVRPRLALEVMVMNWPSMISR